jgi:hypothetical protein
MKEYLVQNGIKELWYLTDQESRDGNVVAKRYEGDWTTDEFWDKVGL